MVDPNLFVVFGHVIDTNMLDRAWVEGTGNAFAKKGSKNLSMLAGRNGHVFHIGEDDVAGRLFSLTTGFG